MASYAELFGSLIQNPDDVSLLEEMVKVVLHATFPKPSPTQSNPAPQNGKMSSEKSQDEPATNAETAEQGQPFPHPFELHCASCGSLMDEPITQMTDGKTVCSGCLETPITRSVPNVVLSNLMKQVFPTESEALRLSREAQGLLESDHKEDSLERVNQAIGLAPALFQPHLAKADILLALGRTEEALAEAQFALTHSPFSKCPGAFLKVGEVLAARQQFEGMSKLCRLRLAVLCVWAQPSD